MEHGGHSGFFDVLPALDARTRELRRLRRCVEAHIADRGGPENISHAERVLIGRAGMLTALIEVQERKFANQNLKARPEDLDLYQPVVSCLRRVFETLGIQRRSRDRDSEPRSNVARSSVWRGPTGGPTSMRHRSRRSPRFSLTSTQRQTIFAVTQSLPPLQRHSFLLHVSHTLLA